MAKKKRSNLGIKTSRYFTKTCSSCGHEYPNWFVSCPNCGMAWDHERRGKETVEEEKKAKKNIKIVAKVTEEQLKQPIDSVNLIFSADQGKNWYRQKMEYQSDYYITEIIEVPPSTIIIYSIEVIFANGKTVIENNDGNYYRYIVGGTEGETEEDQTSYKRVVPENIKAYRKSDFHEYFKPEKEKPPEYLGMENSDFPEASQEAKDQVMTILGEPQTEKDPDLQICPNCNSRIKKMWSTCPICGHRL